MHSERTQRSKRKPTGIDPRHSRSCPAAKDKQAKCRCRPTYAVWVYSKRDAKKIYSTHATEAAAKAWRADSTTKVNRGTMAAPTCQTLREVAEAFIEGIEAGTILNRNGKPYKPSVRRGYATDLRKFVLDDLGGHRLSEIRRRDVQAFVDRLVSEGQSATR